MLGWTFFYFFGGRKLTCPSMAIISAIRKTDKGPQESVGSTTHPMTEKLLRHGMVSDTNTQTNMGPSVPRRQISIHAWHQACDSTSEWEGHEQA